MGGPEKIKQKIIDEAQDRAAQIIDQAQRKADELIKKAKINAQNKKEQILQKAQQDAQRRKERIISAAQLEMKKNILSAKRDMIDQAFDRALQAFKDMEKSKYQDIMMNMFLNNVQTGDEEVIVASLDADRIDQEFVDKVNEQLVQNGKKGELKLSSVTKNIQGGFILRSGGVEINSSFEAVIRALREDMEPEIAQILFK